MDNKRPSVGRKIWNTITTIILVTAVGAICFVVGNYVSINDVLGVFGKSVEPTADDIIAIIEPAENIINNEYFYKGAFDIGTVEDEFGVRLTGEKYELAIAYEGVIATSYNIKNAGVEVDSKEKKIKIAMPEPSVKCTGVDKDSLEYAKSFWSDLTTSTDSPLSGFGIGNGKASKLEEKEMIELLKKDAAANEAFTGIVENNAEEAITMILGSDKSTKDYEVKFNN